MKLENGKEVQADLIIGADGVHVSTMALAFNSFRMFLTSATVPDRTGSGGEVPEESQHRAELLPFPRFY